MHLKEIDLFINKVFIFSIYKDLKQPTAEFSKAELAEVDHHIWLYPISKLVWFGLV